MNEAQPGQENEGKSLIELLFNIRIPPPVLVVLMLIAIALLGYALYLGYRNGVDPCGLCESYFNMQCSDFNTPRFG